MNEAKETNAQSTALATTTPSGDGFVQQFQAQVQQAKAMRNALATVMKELMHDKVHFGVMPGTTTKEGEEPKKVLFKAGAELLCNVFHLIPKCEITKRVEEPTFIHFEVHCSVRAIGSNTVVAEADGSANTREERYYNQCTSKLCPVCKKPTIFRSKNPLYGWFCWEKKGGCKAEFGPEDKGILGQDGQLTEVKVWNLHNTVIQQANKRAMVAAVRLATACSDTFTQDMLPDPADSEPGDDPQPAQRTSRTTPAQAPKAGVTEVQKLTTALIKLEIGTAVDPALPKEQQVEQTKKARLGWANAHLSDAGEPEVKGFLELTPEQVKWLLEKAAAGTMPSGW